MSDCCRRIPGFARLRGGFSKSGLDPFHGYFKEPTLATCADPALLLDLDFSTPVIQPFPATNAELTALGLPAATAIWTCEDLAPPLVDSIGGVNLQAGVGGTSEPLVNRMAGGFWNGVNSYSKKAIEFDVSTWDRFHAANNALLDPGTDSFAVLLVFRNWWSSSGARRYISKWSPGLRGWIIYQYPTCRVWLEDTVGNVVQLNVATFDVAWHCFLMVVDWTSGVGGNVGFWSSGGHTPVQSLAALNGNLASTASFSIGGEEPINAGSLSNQVAYCAYWQGANAIGMGQTDFDNFWVHGSDPTGLLTTASHASVLGDIVDNDPATGAIFSDETNDAVVIGYNAGLSNTNHRGLRCATQQSTMLTQSDAFNNPTWVATNITVSGPGHNSVCDPSPRGDRCTCRLLATANNGYLSHSWTPAGAGIIYTQTVFVKRYRTMANDVSGRLVMYNVTGGVEAASVPFTATSTWQRISLTSSVGSLNAQMRIEITNNTEMLSVFRACVVSGYDPRSIYARNAVATCALTDYRIVGPAGAYIRSLQGEADIDYICDVNISPGFRHLYYTDNAAPNLHRALVNALSQPLWATNNSVGAYSLFAGAIADQSIEHSIRHLWDSVNPIDAGTHVFGVDNTVPYNDGVGPYVATETITTIHLGQDGVANNQLQGLLARLRCYDGPRCLRW